MCTVTFVRSGSQQIITSNRDEQVVRQAIEPRTYNIGNKKITFPKDPKAGGTWYAADQLGNVIVLLNGAAETHQRTPPYRKSRGIILLEIFTADAPVILWNQIDLENIEPFTLILFQEVGISQMRWNGQEKELVFYDNSTTRIWSSATLYSKEVREARQRWFDQFMKERSSPTSEEMFDFHRHTKPDNKQNGLVIDRKGFLKTISITQTIVGNRQLSMKHFDLVDQITSEVDYEII